MMDTMAMYPRPGKGHSAAGPHGGQQAPEQEQRVRDQPPGTRVPDRPWPAFCFLHACKDGMGWVTVRQSVSQVKSDVHREHGWEVSRTRACKGMAGQGRARQGWTRLGCAGTAVPRRQCPQRGDDEGQGGGTRLEVEMGSYTVESPGGEKGEG